MVASRGHTARTPPMRFYPGTVAVALLVTVMSALRADPVISEFMAANARTLADVDGKFSDWIEIHNPDTTAVNLSGWFLTDDAKDLKKWQFPEVTVPPGGFLVVFASGKSRREPGAELHTNFELDAGGGYLGLVRPDGVTVASQFGTKYPPQLDDFSYGVTQTLAAGETAATGYFRAPTPRARNGGADTLMLTELVTLSRTSGPFSGTLAVTLSGAGEGQKIRYVLAGPGASGAVVPEPTADSPLYSGPISISASTVLRAAVFSADDKRRGRPTTAHYARLGATGSARVDTFSSQLPLMVVDVHGSGGLEKDGRERAGWIYAWNPPAAGGTALTGAPAVATPLSVNVRGSSSAEFPKKGYTVRLLDAEGRDNAKGLFGLPSFDTWVLVGPWTYDPTYLHNVLMYDLAGRLGHWAPRTQAIELFLNTDGGDLDQADYAGLYILTDALRIAPGRVDLATLGSKDITGSDVTGGYLMKFDVPAAEDFSFQTSRNYPGAPNALIVTNPSGPDLVPAQKEYIRSYVQGFEDALYADLAAGWRQRTHLDFIERAAWVDYHLLNTLSMNADGFIRSAYLHKDRRGKLVAGPLWDYDRALGGGDPRTVIPEAWSVGAGAVDPWTYGWWGMLVQDPDFLQAWIDRWQRLRRDELSSTNLAALVDGQARRIGAAAAARDAARWPDNASRFPGGWAGEVENLKDFLRRKCGWIDTKFAPVPGITNADGVLTLTPAPGTQVAYTTDGSDPRASGGGIAAAAKLSASPVRLPNASNLLARTYRTASGTLPSSPWSSPVANPGRLVNLSLLTELAAEESFTLGFVVGGVGTVGSKPLLVRAAGPSLGQLGVANPHSDPKLELFVGAAKAGENDNWGGSSGVAGAFLQVGAFAYSGASSRDAAVFDAAVAPGNNSVIVSGVGSAAGTVIAELYDASPSALAGQATPRLVNVSVLKSIGAGLTAGFVVGGGSARSILVRAIGPTLKKAFGVTGTDDDPRLTLFSGETKLASNDNWGGGASLKASFASVGAFSLSDSSNDAALVASLPPGNYTVQVAGEKAVGGVVLVEIYELP
jgi:hypothetical protein